MYRIIKYPDFTQFSPTYLDIDDLVLVFNNGKKWKVIALSDMCQYPVIYDKYYENGKTDKNISITFCPFSYSSVVYFDEWIPLKETYKNNIILQYKKNKKIKIHQLSGKFIESSDISETDTIVLRKNEIVIMKIKNVLKNYPDCLYFNNGKIIESIIPKNYLKTDTFIYPLASKLDTRFSPKKLVYGVLNSSNDIPSVIASKNNEIDFDESGYQDYFETHIKDIKDNGGFIVPCLWFSWMEHYPDSMVVEI